MKYKYTIVSLLATGTDFIIFSLLIYSFSLYNASATGVGMLAGAVVSWTLHYTWVFSESTQTQARKNSLYFAGILLSFLLNIALMGILTDWFSFPQMFCRVLTATSVWLIIYWFNRRVVFGV